MSSYRLRTVSRSVSERFGVLQTDTRPRGLPGESPLMAVPGHVSLVDALFPGFRQGATMLPAK